MILNSIPGSMVNCMNCIYIDKNLFIRHRPHIFFSSWEIKTFIAARYIVKKRKTSKTSFERIKQLGIEPSFYYKFNPN